MRAKATPVSNTQQDDRPNKSLMLVLKCFSCVRLAQRLLGVVGSQLRILWRMKFIWVQSVSLDTLSARTHLSFRSFACRSAKGNFSPDWLHTLRLWKLPGHVFCWSGSSLGKLQWSKKCRADTHSAVGRHSGKNNVPMLEICWQSFNPTCSQLTHVENSKMAQLYDAARYVLPSEHHWSFTPFY